MADQYTRTRRMLGQPALDTLRGAHVAVFGIGGVGGHAAEVLARSGVGELSLFDSDQVALSNLNRQLVALHSTLGQYKVDVMAARIADIDPTIRVHPYRMFYGPETADSVDLTRFDYVVDCIDTVTAKLLLITRCKALDVPILCSMGAANKLDPTAFTVTDITRTNTCPLAKVIRVECRKRGIGHLKVVYSTEPALPPMDDPADGEQPAAGRRTVPASNAFVPAACGLVVGGEAVKDLLRAAGTLRTE
ncbi:MAG: ThiF family adenylyltransferase [Gemmiger sp.]